MVSIVRWLLLTVEEKEAMEPCCSTFGVPLKVLDPFKASLLVVSPTLSNVAMTQSLEMDCSRQSSSLS